MEETLVLSFEGAIPIPLSGDSFIFLYLRFGLRAKGIGLSQAVQFT